MSKELIQQLRDALDEARYIDRNNEAIAAADAYLTQSEQEPMTNPKEVMKLVDEYAQAKHDEDRSDNVTAARAALYAALAYPAVAEAKAIAAAYERGWQAALAGAGEPVAWADEFRDSVLNQRGLMAENGMTGEQINDVLGLFDSLYTHPPRTEPVVLTDEQIDKISNGVNGIQRQLSQRESRREFARAVLAAAIPPGHVVVPVEQMQHWLEYWNGNENERAMAGALHHILGEIEAIAARPGEK